MLNIRASNLRCRPNSMFTLGHRHMCRCLKLMGLENYLAILRSGLHRTSTVPYFLTSVRFAFDLMASAPVYQMRVQRQLCPLRRRSGLIRSALNRSLTLKPAVRGTFMGGCSLRRVHSRNTNLENDKRYSGDTNLVP